MRCAACGEKIIGDAITFTVGGRDAHYHPSHAPATAGEVREERPARRRLVLGPGTVNDENTRVLRASKLRARSVGDFTGALLQAGYYAKKTGKTMFAYQGNAFMHAVWRVSEKPAEYLDPVNNTGSTVLSVSPELVVSYHPVERRID